MTVEDRQGGDPVRHNLRIEQVVPFLRSVIDSGERLDHRDVDIIQGLLAAATPALSDQTAANEAYAKGWLDALNQSRPATPPECTCEPLRGDPEPHDPECPRSAFLSARLDFKRSELLRAAADSRPAELDVERLARAIALAESQAPDDENEDELREWRDKAENIAAAHARLASTEADQAENTPVTNQLGERPAGYPHGEFDAMKWAEEFDRIFPDRRPDTDTMLGWFANAIMTGYDKAKNEKVWPDRRRLIAALWGMDFADTEATRLADKIIAAYASTEADQAETPEHP